MRKEICNLLGDLDIRPVLMDVGASGEPLPIWNEIAPQSIYIGFDPDLREIHEDRSSQFHRSVMVNEAVIAENASEVSFYLTRSPFCSTTLAPDPAAAAHWLESDSFEVESRAAVRATTIEFRPEASRHSRGSTGSSSIPRESISGCSTAFPPTCFRG